MNRRDAARLLKRSLKYLTDSPERKALGSRASLLPGSPYICDAVEHASTPAQHELQVALREYISDLIGRQFSVQQWLASLSYLPSGNLWDLTQHQRDQLQAYRTRWVHKMIADFGGV